jgi:DnaJ-class molecular chaperone
MNHTTLPKWAANAARDCRACGGSGEQVEYHACPDCLGTGRMASTDYSDVLLALKWCRARRNVMARYLATRARAMRPVQLPGAVA